MQTHKLLFFIFSGLLVWYLSAAYFLPLTQDEAYYLSWAHKLAAGYFDHPPGVAWLAHSNQLLPLPKAVTTAFSGRLPAIALTLLGLFGLLRFYRLCGLQDAARLAPSALACCGSAAVLLGGFLTTPDSALFCSWVWALYACALALTKHPSYWLLAGFFTGLGLLSKYTMLLIGPVFLLVLLAAFVQRQPPRQGQQPQLFSAWPYGGGVVALAIFLPNLLWNAQHEWITWKFQLRHGLALHRSELGLGTTLPKPLPESADSPERILAEKFVPPGESIRSSEAQFQAVQAKNQQGDPVLSWLKRFTAGQSLLTRLGDYGGGQLALWGALLFSFIWGWISKYRHRHEAPARGAGIDRRLLPLLAAGTAVPLLVFAAFALKGKVEANWGAVYLVSAAPLLAEFCTLQWRAALLGTLVNALLLATLIVYTRLPFGRINPGFDRVLQETHGYEQLAQWIATKAGARSVYADTYQLVAMLAQKGLQGRVGQWPGLTRSSEFVREPSWQPLSWQELKRQGTFVLVTSQLIPPRIPDFKAETLIQIKDCRQGYFEIQESFLDPEPRPCAAVHRWRVVEYSRKR